ncbi:MAG: shikimate kinase [Bifidobacteriaceae bacterium]|nr:shikimate kinase [Bifidobacteriaceae bacterium]
MTALVLIGPPAAGKTTVGRELAELLGLGFIDTDEEIEGRTGMTIGQIFVEQGEEAFRAIERQVVFAALAQVKTMGGVIALGGGAPMDAAAAAALAGMTVVFLDISAALAARRVGLDATRPLLAESPRKVWRELMGRRRPVYEGLASLTVEVDGLSPAEVAGMIATMVTGQEGLS